MTGADPDDPVVKSADESDVGWSEQDGAAGSDRDDELRREVPPHHG